MDMTTTQSPTRAQQIRAALKAAFPGTKFSVRKGTGTACLWVDVTWTDGPTEDRVKHITGAYPMGGGDYSGTLHHRSYSDAAQAWAKRAVTAQPWRWANDYDLDGGTYYAERRALAEEDFTAKVVPA